MSMRAKIQGFVRSSFKVPSATPGWNLDVWSFLPSAEYARPHPIIVMANGLGCNKQMNLAPFAEAYARNGYACVVFDYRRWGVSDGTLRNCVFVNEQLEDYRTVLKYCRSRPEYDPSRTVLWGFSFAGGHVLTLSAENNLNIAATIAQSPYTGRPFPFRWRSFLYYKYFFSGILDYVKQFIGLGPSYISTTGPPGSLAMLSAPGVFEGFKSVINDSRDFLNKISASTFFRIPFYSPRATASSITCPVLLIAPRKDITCPYQSTLDVSELVEKAEVLKVSGNHFDMFPGNVDHEVTLERELEFLHKHVPVA